MGSGGEVSCHEVTGEGRVTGDDRRHEFFVQTAGLGEPESIIVALWFVVVCTERRSIEAQIKDYFDKDADEQRHNPVSGQISDDGVEVLAVDPERLWISGCSVLLQSLQLAGSTGSYPGGGSPALSTPSVIPASVMS